MRGKNAPRKGVPNGRIIFAGLLMLAGFFVAILLIGCVTQTPLSNGPTSEKAKPGWALEASVDELISVVKDRDEDIFLRRACVFYLGERKDPRAVSTLLGALQDEDWFIRRNAAVALGKIGDPRAIEPLIAALGDEKLVVRAEAAVALTEMAGTEAEAAVERFSEEIDTQEILQNFQSYIERARKDIRGETGSEALLILAFRRNSNLELALEFSKSGISIIDCPRLRDAVDDFLITTFQENPNRDLAEDLINYGGPRASRVARKWAKENGYQIWPVFPNTK